MADPEPPVDQYRPTTPRARLIIIVVTVSIVLGLWYLMIYKPGWHARDLGPRPCLPGQTTNCIGGQADVMLLPAEPASAAASGP